MSFQGNSVNIPGQSFITYLVSFRFTNPENYMYDPIRGEMENMGWKYLNGLTNTYYNERFFNPHDDRNALREMLHRLTVKYSPLKIKYILSEYIDSNERLDN